MGLAIFMLFIVAIFLVVVALVVTGIIFIVFGIENKKKGGKGKLKTIGIVMLAIPIVCFLCIGGKTLWTNARIKCVADEWRYKSILIPRNSVMSSQDMLRSMLESVDDKDKDKIYVVMDKYSIEIFVNGMSMSNIVYPKESSDGFSINIESEKAILKVYK